MHVFERFAVSAPVIQTARLRLRGHRADDLSAAFAMWSDPRVVQFIGKPSTEQQTWHRILGYVGHWNLMSYGFWAVEERTSGRFVGELGFADFKRDVGPEMRNAPEMGWVITPAAQGQGFASEGLAAALTWGDAHFGSVRSVCIIDPANAASLRVAQKCGFREFKRTLYLGAPAAYFERTPDAPIR